MDLKLEVLLVYRGPTLIGPGTRVVAAGGAAWPPSDVPGWSDAVVDAGRQWSSWVEDRAGPVPDLLVREWGLTPLIVPRRGDSAVDA